MKNVESEEILQIKDDIPNTIIYIRGNLFILSLHWLVLSISQILVVYIASLTNIAHFMSDEN